MKNIFVAALVAASFLIPVSSATAKPAKYKAGSCAQRVADVKQRPGHWQAVAQSNKDSKGNFSCSAKWAASSKAEAIAKAISGCEHETSMRPTWGIPGTCHIVIVK
ncbi:hypothetical protein [Aestuariivirga litoralis]|uniref:hypothetical protein n=1 Tax=Aestuariivirga litoralis TaxID=2650924 RepID=UPI0018C46F4C|nr:hypothetical protein [Aestuariivirga litoralis]MBG1233160.1 hypothetical protein [Aestuariivirga litoralis]